MQATCPKCAHRVVVDDVKAPDRAFSVKCPKCQTPVKFAGKGATAPAAAPVAEPAVSAAPVPAAAVEVPAAPRKSDTQELRAGMMAQLRREMGIAGPGGEPTMRALLALADAAQAQALSHVLVRQGFNVDPLDASGEALRVLEQGGYDLVATSRSVSAGGNETVSQRIGRLNPDGRRRIFLILVGDEFKTGDGTQAFAAMADMVVNARDVAQADGPLRNSLAERTRLYQMFLDARRRFEASAG